MLDALATRPDPFVYFIALFPLSLVALALGYTYAARYGSVEDGRAEGAFGLGQAAIFGLIALILAFSFNFAAERFEARRALVVAEADAIGTAYLRAGFLPFAQSVGFRKILVAYARARLTAYAQVSDMRAERRSIEAGKNLQGRLWAMASGAARRDSRNLSYRDLVTAVSETIDASDQQVAALDSHVPRAIIGIVLLSTVLGAGLLGLTFGRAKAPNAVLSAIFCLLFAATVFTIIDLDHPQGGLTGVDIVPLQSTLDDMRSAP